MPLARGQLAFDLVDSLSEPSFAPSTLVVIGGGSLIDRAKRWRRDHAPAAHLVAVPSLWGSGADASPVAVFTVGERKVIEMSDALRPDARSTWPDLADLVPPAAACAGYGDTWSHALEGFFSPLASTELRTRLAAFIKGPLLDAPLERDPAWFDLSAQACAFQAGSGVGLVHGVAHRLEAGSGRSHAQWCSLMLWPVMRFNFATSTKVRELVTAYALPWTRIDARIRELHEPAAYDAAVASLREQWNAILREPLTRINPALVRPDSLAYFEERRFDESAA